jgi:uncharacterized protein (TIGR02246 family)
MRSRFLPLLAGLAVLALAACAPPPAAKTGSAADEQAIRDMGTKYAAAFNSRDAKAIAAMTAMDYENVDPMGKHTQGRAAVESGMTDMWKQMPPDLKMTATTVFVKWIDADHAIAGGTYQMAGMPAGMPNHGAWMGVAVKQDSTWVMMSSLSGDAPPDVPAPVKAKGK